MALFNHLFPYSNLHDINLDWIISIIKSIDPAVIQALQELTPDIIEQVNQKVNEAQAAAIAAQSSASEANTARENAATSAAEAAQDATNASADAALANADAVRAENAKTEVENSLVPVDMTVTSDHANLYTSNVRKSGRFANVIIEGVIQSLPDTERITLAKINGDFLWSPIICIKSVNDVVNAQYAATVETDGRVTIAKSLFTIGNKFAITGVVGTSA